MRFIHLYLIAYFLLLIGAGIALWNAGAFQHIPIIWMAIAAILAVGLGVLLAITSVRPSNLS